MWKWVCFHESGNKRDAVNFYKIMENASKAYGLKVSELKCVEIYNNSKANYWINEAEKYFHKDKESNYDFAVFLIGRNDDYFIYWIKEALLM